MGLNAGELDRPVTIQQLTETAGSSGFPREDWTLLADPVWMLREEQRGQERFTAARNSAPSVTLWQMRYRADMDPEVIDVLKKRRLVYQGWIYDITSAVPIGRREGIELLTLGRRAEGA